DPPTTSAEPPRTRTRDQTTDETDVSPEQFADHLPDPAQLTTRNNAAMESFFSLLQKNVLDRRRCDTPEELRIAIITWIERTYHRRRRQAALGRLTPVEFEAIMTTPASQAAQRKLSPIRAADPMVDFHLP